MSTIPLRMAPIVPSGVIVVEETTTATDESLSPHPEEVRALGRACELRRLEFAAGRRCARMALRLLDHVDVPILRGQQREPRWPDSIVGSITHCSGYCAAAVARTQEFRSIGIDAELDAPLPRGVLAMIAREEEYRWLSETNGSGVCWDRLLFCAKESIFKAWFPLTRSWIGFRDALVSVDPQTQSFSASIVAEDLGSDAGMITSFSGRYLMTAGHILTLVSVPCA